MEERWHSWAYTERLAIDIDWKLFIREMLVELEENRSFSGAALPNQYQHIALISATGVFANKLE